MPSRLQHNSPKTHTNNLLTTHSCHPPSHTHIMAYLTPQKLSLHQFQTAAASSSPSLHLSFPNSSPFKALDLYMVSPTSPQRTLAWLWLLRELWGKNRPIFRPCRWSERTLDATGRHWVLASGHRRTLADVGSLFARFMVSFCGHNGR